MSHVVITSADDERTDPVMLRSSQRALHIAISSIAPDYLPVLTLLLQTFKKLTPNRDKL